MFVEVVERRLGLRADRFVGEEVGAQHLLQGDFGAVGLRPLVRRIEHGCDQADDDVPDGDRLVSDVQVLAMRRGEKAQLLADGRRAELPVTIHGGLGLIAGACGTPSVPQSTLR